MPNILNLLSEECFVEASNNLLEKLDMQNNILTAIASNNGGLTVKSWADVQKIVRRGLAKNVFKTGDQLSCKKGDETLVWDVVDFDHDIPEDSPVSHTLTLQLHYTYKNTMPFDTAEALYYAADTLSAQTYCVDLDGNFFTEGAGVFQFTLTKDVPKGGQVVLSWNSNKNISSSKIVTYPSATSFTPIESVDITEGSEGTKLTTLNNYHYVRYGNSDWSQSNIRRWLNSASAPGEWVAPATNYDRFNQNSSYLAGFLNNVDSDFKNALYAMPRKFEQQDGSTVSLTDLISLPKKAEIYGDMTHEVAGVTPFEYYTTATTLSAAGNGEDAGRVKYGEDGVAKNCGLATIDTGSSFPRMCALRVNGALIPLSANTYVSYAPICTIA